MQSPATSGETRIVTYFTVLSIVVFLFPKNDVLFFPLALTLEHWANFSGSRSFLQTVELVWQVISSSQGLCLNKGQHKRRINAYTHQTPLPCVGLEHTIPASERASDLSANVTDKNDIWWLKIHFFSSHWNFCHKNRYPPFEAKIRHTLDINPMHYTV
jgi:hypothetical protein